VRNKPDLILVDLGLPDRDGLEVIRAVRTWSTVPIVVLFARTMAEQKIAALDAGADDYVTKPFGAAELLARVRAALRRSVQRSEQQGRLRIGGTEIDLTRRQASGPQGELHLTPLEYRVLETLSHANGMIVRQDQLIAKVWGPRPYRGHTQPARMHRESARQTGTGSEATAISADRGGNWLSVAVQ
jgi:two-component system KDP operon response regulator KdpE